MFLVEQRLAPRPPGGIQRFLSLLGNRSGPPAHRLTTDLHASSHFTLVVSLSQQLQSRKAPLLQSSEISFNAARITHASYDDSQWQEVTLYYARLSNYAASLLLRHLRLAAGDSGGLEVSLGFLAGGRQIGASGGGVEVRSQGADGLDVGLVFLEGGSLIGVIGG